MKTEFYKDIELESELEELKDLFGQNNILFEVSSPQTIIDETIVGSGMFAKYTMKILPSDFTRANELVKKLKTTKPIRVEDYGHLKALDNSELRDILENPDEWSVESEIVARKLLQERGIEISEQEIESVKRAKILKVRQGKSVSPFMQFSYFVAIILGFYLGLIFIIAGIGMGYYYSYGTSMDSDGEKYFVYDEEARKNGKLILFGGIICFFIQMYLLFKMDVF